MVGFIVPWQFHLALGGWKRTPGSAWSSHPTPFLFQSAEMNKRNTPIWWFYLEAMHCLKWCFEDDENTEIRIGF